MYAARQNKVDITKILIANGANLKAKSDRGYSAKEYAEMSKAWDTYKVISDELLKTQGV
jgi:ankyrin repeat protein